VLVLVTNAIVGIDLADKRQMVVVTDHDSRVIARRTFRCRALGSRRSAGLGRRAGRREGLGRGDGVVRADRAPVAVLAQLAADRSMPFVCVQPMVTSWSRRTE
jgi:transposase